MLIVSESVWCGVQSFEVIIIFLSFIFRFFSDIVYFIVRKTFHNQHNHEKAFVEKDLSDYIMV